MEPVILDGVETTIPVDELAQRLHVREGSGQLAELRSLVREAEAVARPRAIAGIAYIDERGDDYVVVDGVRLTSRVLAVNLAQTHRVFPYVATCGVELDEWARSLDDILHSFWSEAIREVAMRCALRAVFDYQQRTYKPGDLSRMNPGSLADWPLEQQAPLFRLLGDPAAAIGVRLTESMLMVPSKSVSGICFGGAGTFESCMLCPREVCPSRRAAYDPGLYDQRYRKL